MATAAMVYVDAKMKPLPVRSASSMALGRLRSLSLILGHVRRWPLAEFSTNLAASDSNKFPVSAHFDVTSAGPILHHCPCTPHSSRVRDYCSRSAISEFFAHLQNLSLDAFSAAWRLPDSQEAGDKMSLTPSALGGRSPHISPNETKSETSFCFLSLLLLLGTRPRIHPGCLAL